MRFAKGSAPGTPFVARRRRAAGYLCRCRGACGYSAATGPAVRQGDEAWFNIVRWTLYGLLNAEELGVTSSNVERQARDSRNPDVARLLGSEGDAGKDLQLPRDWVVQMVRQVGNYGEIFARNVGDGSPLKMPRGLNAQWNLGGLHYAPPIR